MNDGASFWHGPQETEDVSEFLLELGAETRALYLIPAIDPFDIPTRSRRERERSVQRFG